MRNHSRILGSLLLAGVLGGCSMPTEPTQQLAPEGAATLEAGRPAGQFRARSDHPYFPLVPGTTFHYRARTDEGIQTEQVIVTDRTKVIQGVRTRVVEDVVRLNGEVIERTFDWFAQDEKGNVWYFGEDVRHPDGSTTGSWEAGKNGARAGILMPARPRVGQSYQEENAPGVAEDRARVLALDARARVPYGSFRRCLHTENTTPLEPDVLETKFYAPNVGLVLEVEVSEGGVRNELVKITRPSRERDDDDRDRGDRRGSRKDDERRKKDRDRDRDD